MEIGQIFEALEFNSGCFPYGPVREALTRREEMVPELLRILEEAAANPGAIRDPGYFAVIYALYMLAQFREKAAYPLIARLMMNEIDLIERLIGDVVTEALTSILASVSHGDTGPIKAIIENEAVERFFVDFKSVEHAFNEKTGEEVIDDLKRDDRFCFVTDVVASLDWWACFRPKEGATPEMTRKALKAEGFLRANTVEYRKALGKVGRNDPCPCGSEKYKRCCGD